MMIAFCLLKVYERIFQHINAQKSRKKHQFMRLDKCMMIEKKVWKNDSDTFGQNIENQINLK